MTKWYEWLPDTPINAIGAELVMDVLQDVEWYLIAALVLAGAEQTAKETYRLVYRNEVILLCQEPHA